jgi:hypothetical protein
VSEIAATARNSIQQSPISAISGDIWLDGTSRQIDRKVTSVSILRAFMILPASVTAITGITDEFVAGSDARRAGC